MESPAFSQFKKEKRVLPSGLSPMEYREKAATSYTLFSIVYLTGYVHEARIRSFFFFTEKKNFK